MATNLTCPDCGGVLGPAEPGVTRCNCFKDESYSQADFTPSNEASLSDTQPVETLSKLCCKCGADVAGKKRYKDSRGYMCPECNKAEIQAEKAGTALCPDCGRRVKEAGLVEFRGSRICKLCIAEQRDADKKKIKVVSGKAYEAQDTRTLKILIAVMLILVVFMVMSYFKSRS